MDERNRRWCSEGFEIGCDNGERVRVVFARSSPVHREVVDLVYYHGRSIDEVAAITRVPSSTKAAAVGLRLPPGVLQGLFEAGTEIECNRLGG